MGAGTVIRDHRSSSTSLLRGFDLPLLVTVVVLIVFGVIMLFSSSWDFSFNAYGDAMHMFNRQIT